MNTITLIIYLLTTLLLILGLRKMSSPKTARRGIVIAGWGMLAAVLATFATLIPFHFTNLILMLVAMGIGFALAQSSGNRVKMINMPQMIALYNGMGGGAAAAIAAIELLNYQTTASARILAILCSVIGMVSFSGSLMAFAKLQGLIQRSITVPRY